MKYYIIFCQYFQIFCMTLHFLTLKIYCSLASEEFNRWYNFTVHCKLTIQSEMDYIHKIRTKNYTWSKYEWFVLFSFLFFFVKPVFVSGLFLKRLSTKPFSCIFFLFLFYDYYYYVYTVQVFIYFFYTKPSSPTRILVPYLYVKRQLKNE